MSRPTKPIIFLATILAMLVMVWMVSSVSVAAASPSTTALLQQQSPARANTPEVFYTQQTDTLPTEAPPVDAQGEQPPPEPGTSEEQLSPEPESQQSSSQSQPGEIPVVEPSFLTPTASPYIHDLDQFINTVADGQSGALRGVFAPGLFAYPVTEQPAYDNNWVSTNDNEVTLFRAAEQFGVTALLAHNTLAGYIFDGLKNGDTLYLVYGDGSNQAYRITGQESYQALEPSSPISDFIDLSTGQQMTSGDVFDRVYTGAYPLVLQTCIEKDGNTKWGRLFLTAAPE